MAASDEMRLAQLVKMYNQKCVDSPILLVLPLECDEAIK